MDVARLYRGVYSANDQFFLGIASLICSATDFGVASSIFFVMQRLALCGTF